MPSLPASCKTILKDIKASKPLIAMLAPSFVVDFPYPDIIINLKRIGFDKVCELTFGSKMINDEYQDILKQNPNKMFISSACPAVVMLIKNKFKQYTDNLMPVVSPVISTAKIMKKQYPNHKFVFFSPCLVKREEVKAYPELGITVITFKELKQLIKYTKKNKLLKKAPAKHLFDKFYVDYTKIYPLSGGMTDTMKKTNILKKSQVIVLEGSKELLDLFSKGIPKNIKFLDILFCLGGCIGGSEINSTKTIKERDKMVRDYLKAAKKEKIGTRKGKVKDAEGVKFTSPDDYVDTSCLKITKES